ncbi:pisatin demethylase [Paraphaeosphaeria sporulosa]
MLDLGDWMQYYTFDAIGELYFGAPFGFLATGSDHGGWIQALDTLFPIFIAACAAPRSMRWLLPVFALLNGRSRAALGAFEKMIQAAKACVAERQAKMMRGEEQGRVDLLAKLFDIKAAHEHMKTEGVDGDFTLAEVEQEAFVGIFAGSDTTAIALRSIFYHLMRSPTTYHKLRSEIDESVKAGTLLKGSDGGYMRYIDAIRLPYLTACCKEGMRLHPSIGMTMPRHVPEGGATIAGRRFQGGDRVGMNAAVVHYDTTVFGDDAGEFRPERWLDGLADVRCMDRHMLQFSAGARACLGKNIALVEIYKLVPQLVWEFDIELLDPGQEWVTTNAFLNKQTGIFVKLHERR